MYAQVDKYKENRGGVVANLVSQEKSNGKQIFSFVDNRPEVVWQHKMQVMTKNSPMTIQRQTFGKAKRFQETFSTKTGLQGYILSSSPTKKNAGGNNAKKKDIPSEHDLILEHKGDTTNLTSVEAIHEDIFSNLLQGSTKKTNGKINEKRYEEYLKKLQSEETQKTNLNSQLISIRKAVLEGNALIRKLSEGEKSAFENDPSSVFQKGKESMKAFRVDETYSFKDKDRNKSEGAYDYVLQIDLTPVLKTYFINYLSANIKNPIDAKDEEFKFTFNPQFKYEGGALTILIPKAGWKQFWSFASSSFKFLSS